jgi:hypothetical protein
MTPEEWERCTNPQRMLRLLQGRAADRQVRLLLCACCRACWDQLRDERSRQAVAVAERFADEPGDERGLQAAYRGALAALHEALEGSWGRGPSRPWEGSTYAQKLAPQARLAAEAADPLVGGGSAVALAELAMLQGSLADLLREVFNPFRQSALAPAVLAYNGHAARRLAEVIYDSRRFEDLPVLADLLEEAGCTDAALLGHLRGPGPHVLGCHALDAALGKS